MIANAPDLLRLILAYCLGERGLRSTAAWASAIGLADMSDVALLYRLRQCGDWLALLIGQVLASAAPEASHGRLIRIVDATTVPKAGTAAKQRNQRWRIHSAFDLPSERFGCFELTDQHGGERLDRIPVVKSLPPDLIRGARSGLVIVPTCSLIAWPLCWRTAPTSSCAPAGGMRAGARLAECALARG